MTDVTHATTARTGGAQSPFEMQRPANHRERNARGEGELLRRELLENAVRLLSDTENPAEVSIRAIARATGVSPTAAYRHFEDRDDLVYCAIGLAFEEFTATFTDALADTEDPFEALAVAGEAYRDFAAEHPGRYRVLFSNPMACPVTTTATTDEVEAGAESFMLLVSLVSACLDAGAPATQRDVTAEYLAFQLWTWIHGIVDLRITHADADWPAVSQMFDDVLELLGLTAPA